MDLAVERFLLAELVEPERILRQPDLVPRASGVYGWWFGQVLHPQMSVDKCVRRDGFTLLYVGISPSKPRSDGSGGSRQTIRRRIRHHCRGKASTSTLRRSLGCLLADELGIELNAYGASGKCHFGSGEAALSEWIAEHARVSWIEHPEPWLVEDHLIATLDLPLNLEGNQRHPFYSVLKRRRRDSTAGARPITPRPDVG